MGGHHVGGAPEIGESDLRALFAPVAAEESVAADVGLALHLADDLRSAVNGADGPVSWRFHDPLAEIALDGPGARFLQIRIETRNETEFSAWLREVEGGWAVRACVAVSCNAESIDCGVHEVEQWPTKTLTHPAAAAREFLAATRWLADRAGSHAADYWRTHDPLRSGCQRDNRRGKGTPMRE
jgi:hypothetical protein